MKTMSVKKWTVAPVALVLALGVGGTVYAKGNGGMHKKADPAQAEIKRLEKVMGVPLTDQQKTDINAAQVAYHESEAKALGLTVDQLDAKMKDYAKAQRDARKNNMGAGTAAPAAATTTPVK